MRSVWILPFLLLASRLPGASPELMAFEGYVADGKLLMAEEKLLPVVENPEACAERTAIVEFYRKFDHIPPKAGFLDRMYELQVLNGCDDPRAKDVVMRKLRTAASSAPDNEARLLSYGRHACIDDPRAYRALSQSADQKEINRAWAKTLSIALEGGNASAIQLASLRLREAVSHVETSQEWEPWLRVEDILKLAANREGPLDYRYSLALRLLPGSAGGAALFRSIPEPDSEGLDATVAVLRERLADRPLPLLRILCTAYGKQTLVWQMKMDPILEQCIRGVAPELSGTNAPECLQALESIPLSIETKNSQLKVALTDLSTALEVAAQSRTSLASIRHPKDCPDRQALELELARAAEVARNVSGFWRTQAEGKRQLLSEAILADDRERAERERTRREQEALVERIRLEQEERARRAEAEAEEERRRLKEELAEIRSHVIVVSASAVSDKYTTELKVRFRNTSRHHIDGFKGTLVLHDQFDEFLTSLEVEGDALRAQGEREYTYSVDSEVHRALKGRVNPRQDWTCTKCRVGGVVH